MTKALEVRHCRVLLAVRDAGGVGAAARALGIAQSTVSETLLSLERLLGAPVTMRRPGRDAMLTSTAEALVPHARLLVATSEAALAAAAMQRQGVVRLGTVESVSSYLLPEPLRAFRNLCPDIEVRIATGLCEDLRARVGRADLDAALTLEGTGQGADTGDGLGTQLRFVVSPQHSMATGIVTRDDLKTQTFLLADPQGGFNALVRSWLKCDERELRLESAGSIDGVKRGVAQGDVIGVLPDYAVADELTARELVALRLEEPLPPISLRLTTLARPEEGSPLSMLIAQITQRHPVEVLEGVR